MILLYSFNHSLMLEICFVCYHQHGEFISVLDPQYLPVKTGQLIERRTVSNGIHQQKSFTRSHVLFSHGTEFFLACSVQDCKQFVSFNRIKWNWCIRKLTVKFGNNIINYTLFCVWVFNRRVVICYEVALEEKRFSC